jgi:hypothetical protein
MFIAITHLHGTLSMEVNESTTMFDLMHYFERMHFLPINQQRWILNQQDIRDPDATMRSLGIIETSRFIVLSRLRGGARIGSRAIPRPVPMQSYFPNYPIPHWEDVLLDNWDYRCAASA